MMVLPVSVLMLAAIFCAPSPGVAQPLVEVDEEESIFQRFALKRRNPKYWQVMIDIPIYLRPQTDPAAKVVNNLGFNYITAFRPDNRFYISRSLGMAITEWEPTSSEIERVKVKTADISFLLNHLTSSFMVTSFGLGLGMMDGLIYFNDDRVFEPRLEPFIPLHFGLGMRLGEGIQAGLKFSQFSFFHSNPLISYSRVLLGIGYNY